MLWIMLFLLACLAMIGSTRNGWLGRHRPAVSRVGWAVMIISTGGILMGMGSTRRVEGTHVFRPIQLRREPGLPPQTYVLITPGDIFGTRRTLFYWVQGNPLPRRFTNDSFNWRQEARIDSSWHGPAVEEQIEFRPVPNRRYPWLALPSKLYYYVIHVPPSSIYEQAQPSTH